MSSGGKREQFNTRERAVSTDINRAQSFVQADMATFFQQWLLSYTTVAGVETLPSGLSSPLTALIVNGLMVKPGLTAQTMTVDPGFAVVQRPDAAPSADDSPVKYVNDPGVSDVTVLTWLANAAGGTRIDIVECALYTELGAGEGTGEIILENVNRDIYNPATGLFAAAAVDKVAAVRFKYRIRRGVSGGGWPGTATGWLPLAVISMPVGAATYDDCIVYDVRPLLSDRALGANRPPDHNMIVDAELHAGFDYEANAAVDTRKFINGRVDALYNGRMVGGALPYTGYDLSTNDYAVPNFLAAMVDGWWNLYLAFPFGLPRWARYDASPRVPGTMRGIPIASQQACDSDGEPTLALTIPTNLGFSATTSTAVRVFSAPCMALYKLLPTSVDNSGWYSTTIFPSVMAFGSPALTKTIVDASNVKWAFDLVEGTNIPVGCKAVEIEGQFSFTQTGAYTSYMNLRVEYFNESAASALSGNAITMIGNYESANFKDAGGETRSLRTRGRFALAPSWPGNAAIWSAHTWHFDLRVYSAGGNNGIEVPASAYARVMGYRI